MLLYRRKRSVLKKYSSDKFEKFLSASAPTFRALVRPSISSQAAILGFPADVLSSAADSSPYQPVLKQGEILTDGESLFVVTVEESRSKRLPAGTQLLSGLENVEDSVLTLHYIGPEVRSQSELRLQKLIDDCFETEIEVINFSSKRFEQLKNEGKATKVIPSAEDFRCARLLADRSTRQLAVALKSSGGLLLRDLPDQVPSEDRGRIKEILEALGSAHLIESDVVVICRKNQSYAARAPSKAVLKELASRGLRGDVLKAVEN